MLTRLGFRRALGVIAGLLVLRRTRRGVNSGRRASTPFGVLMGDRFRGGVGVNRDVLGNGVGIKIKDMRGGLPKNTALKQGVSFLPALPVLRGLWPEGVGWVVSTKGVFPTGDVSSSFFMTEAVTPFLLESPPG